MNTVNVITINVPTRQGSAVTVEQRTLITQKQAGPLLRPYLKKGIISAEEYKNRVLLLITNNLANRYGFPSGSLLAASTQLDLTAARLDSIVGVWRSGAGLLIGRIVSKNDSFVELAFEGKDYPNEVICWGEIQAIYKILFSLGVLKSQ